MLASLVRYTPPPGSTEWHQGAASMANDPLDRRRYNAAFRFYRGESVSDDARLTASRSRLTV